MVLTQDLFALTIILLSPIAADRPTIIREVRRALWAVQPRQAMRTLQVAGESFLVVLEELTPTAGFAVS